MAARAQRGRGAFAIGLRAGDGDSHGHIFLRMILSENRFPLFEIMR
jgi:hypothetical protein